MKGAPGGFTIIEVMIVLSISGVMLGSAITIFSSKRESTYFTQAVYDLRSELQGIANSVSSQSVPGLEDYLCAPASINGKLRPALTKAAPTGQDCIYLGQAIEVAQDKSTLYSYPILGNRTVYSGITNTNNSPTNIKDANPEPAVDSADPSNPAKLLLIHTYNMLNGLKVSSAKLSGAESDILAFYSSLQDNNTSGNEIAVATTNISIGGADPNTTMKQCIEASTCPEADAWSSVINSAWNLCVTNGPRKAQISINGTATGIATKLNMNDCS
jgi:prepilin-type N-terminal cleavage/methylation domain-containing protein